MRQLGTSGLQFLLALVLALALWTFVSFTENPIQEREFVVPVEVNEPAEGLTVIDPATGEPAEIKATTTVRVAGPQSEIQSLSRADLEAVADISALEEGLHTVSIDVTVPRDFRLVNRQPADLAVRLESLETRTFSVTVLKEGQLPFSYTLDASDVATDQVIVRGPQPLVEQVQQVVARINLQGRTASFTESVSLQAVDRNGEPVSGVTLAPDHTKVTVRIEPHLDVQRVSVLPQFEGEPAPGYLVERYDWEPKFVEVFAPVAITGTLRTEPITLTNRTESFTQTVNLIDLDGIVTRLENNTVTVSVSIVPFEVRSSVPLFVPVVPTHLGAGLQASAQPASLMVTVSGTFQQLSQLANTTVQATVDLQGLGPGTYTLPVTIRLPEGLEIVEPAAPQVTVTIERSTP
jgi:YbbR domain-containing protein